MKERVVVVLSLIFLFLFSGCGCEGGRDEIPPETTLLSYPSSLTNATTATFTFSCNEDSCTFQCQLDSGSPEECTSPKEYTGLDEGSHTFRVRAIDRSGNADETPAEYSWTIDLSPPSYSYVSPVSGSALNSNSFPVEITLSENGRCRWSLTSEGYSDMENECEGDGSTSSISCNLTNLIEGQNTVYIACSDSLGNASTSPILQLSYIVDLTPPSFSGLREVILLSDTELILFWERASDNIAQSSEILYDICISNTSGGCSSNFIPRYTTRNLNYKVTELTPGGTYYFLVRARDPAGNRDTNNFERGRGYLQALQVSSGEYHTCAVISDRSVMCWGYNSDGQLGNGGYEDSAVPVKVYGINNAVQVSAGTYHTCAVLSDGKIKCWGDNSSGQLGIGSTGNNYTTPQYVRNINNAVEVSAGGYHTCARLSDNSLKCWGDNGYGQLGNGTNNDSSTPVSVNLGPLTADGISVGVFHSCALISGGSVKCWGYNYYGQLGDGTTTNSNSPVPVIGISNALAVSAGYYHTCAIVDGGVKCWGHNSYGQLGNGTNTEAHTPQDVQNITTAVEISAGWAHTCARLSNNTVMCWGYNAYGQLGDGTTNNSNVPVPVSNLSDVSQISAGGYHTCAVLNDSSIKCWGYNGDGESGTIRGGNSAILVYVPEIEGALHITVGDSHACALMSDHTIRCWGDNDYGQLGNGSNEDSAVPVTVQGINNAVQVSAGTEHTCAVLSDGTLRCWGGNGCGQLGTGNTTNSNIPRFVLNIANAVQVSAGGNHTCALLRDGRIRCWGCNGNGQLGDGTTNNSYTPVSVQGINNGVKVTAGQYYTCALLSDSRVMCWGRNDYGELGDGTTNSSNSPVLVSSLTDAVDVSAGADHTCAVLENGEARCWGYNGCGQLGDGTTNLSYTPVRVSNLNTAIQITASTDEHTCALLSDKSVMCWGDNGEGQLGTGNYIESYLPIPVSYLSNAIEVSAGEDTTCALTSDGNVVCWGSNPEGILGYPYYFLLPTSVQLLLP